ncbi:hypothetical protein RJ639_019608 [Escallonia herrerae]|uniref:Uncharacterized protein n=1 Tax=Escallonia herrerae TaxID=1293975 RepID=A0AA88VAY2_9ASTE|nr:hypothetical protein RJ639_019608 [Escallonia herrerae]
MAVKPNPTVVINKLRFTYPGIDGLPPPAPSPSSTTSPSLSTPAIAASSSDLMAPVSSLEILYFVTGAPCGKTTILKILGGKHMVDPDMVRVLGRSAFHDTALTSSGDLCYLGGEWRREVAFAGFDVAIQMDISAEKMIFGVSGVDPERLAELIKRRRVQICMGLLKPYKVLLLDEITVDLDVLARADLLRFLKKECQERGATIVYATHIFDGLEDWPSHIVYVAHGKLQLAKPMDEVKESSNMSLMRTVENWLRKERDELRKRRKERKANGIPEFEKQVDGTRVTGDPARALNNGWAAGRLNSTVAGAENFVLSSNRVIRQ